VLSPNRIAGATNLVPANNPAELNLVADSGTSVAKSVRHLLKTSAAVGVNPALRRANGSLKIARRLAVGCTAIA
jgi:hypothetical protein